MGEFRLKSGTAAARLLTRTALAGTALAGLGVGGEAGAEPRMEGVLSPPLSVLALAPAAVAVTGAPAEGADREDVLFEADLVTRDVEDGPIVAEGDVRAYFGERYLRADRLVYDPATDIVVAEGAVAITDASSETVFADRVELTGDLRDGVVENFSALLEENARLAADSAVREQGARTRLTRAVYTACNVCDRRGEDKTPTWRIRALRVTRDEERRVVRFRHAFLEIKGVPVLYTPYIQGPDPTVERQSGFLTPLVGASSRLGFNVELPYYFALSNHTDATLFPKYTTDDGTVWQAEVRTRRNNGYHVFSGGIVDFDNTRPPEPGEPTADIPGVRWNVFASGYQDLSPRFRVGYDVERVSDDTYLRNYAIFRRGDLRKELDTSNTNRLRSNLYLKWREGGSEVVVNGYLFQGLRATDDSSLTPYVLPQIDFRHRFQDRVAGGRAELTASFASLQRTSGADTRRVTASANWEREHITRGGHRFGAFASLRGDAYFYQDLDEGDELTNGAPLTPGSVDDPTDLVGRFAPTAGLEWSYPLSKQAAGARIVIEPRVQFVASPSNSNPRSILNEDSQSVEFDYVGLFEFNKSSGFDRFEDGQRVNVGLAASAVFDNGLFVDAAVGEQFRVQSTDAFDLATGLGEKNSDIVGQLDVRYKQYIGIENRFRFDDAGGRLRRAESSAYLNLWRFGANATYVRLDAEATAALPRREELTGRVNFRIARHWTTGFSWRQDLVLSETIRQDFIIAYADECSTFALTYRRDQTQDVGLGTDDAFLVQFTLRSLVD